MLRVNLICVGSLKEQYLRDACKEYIKRLGAFCDIKVTELSECRLTANPGESEVKTALSKEGEKILSLVKNTDYLISMCIEGQQMSSEQLSRTFEKLKLDSYSTVDIVIGSSFGLCESVKSRSNVKLSMSKMTFPHQLARVMVLEQVYRAFSISNNTKYHK